MTESARAEAFASQADKSRALAAQHLTQMINTVSTFRQLRDSVNRMLAEMKIEFRWVDTRLDLMGPLGEWVEGPDLRGMRGYQGHSIELRNNAGIVEWRVHDGASDWAALLDLAAPVQAANSAATLAGEHRQAAEDAAGNAGGFAGDAETARDLAGAFANAPEDAEVVPGAYSAKHHAEKARKSADAAATFEPSDYYKRTEIDDALAEKLEAPDISVKADLIGGKLKVDQRGAVPIARIARTANAQIVAADLGKIFEITSGTFTQTFAAAATLGDGWWAYIRNSGTGDITIPASDGRTNWIMYPGEVRLFQCDGSTLRSVVIVPPGYDRVSWGSWQGGTGGWGGNGGGSNGGSGGSFAFHMMPAPFLPGEIEIPVTVGAGGAGGSGNTWPLNGGASGFGARSFLAFSSPGVSGGAGSSSGAASKGTDSVWGGAGGGGGSIDGPAGAGGVSISAGAGGAGAAGAARGSDGQAPGGGGGGGGAGAGAVGGNGARGEIRVYGSP